jgi:S-methylmethionine-dependent homocysteine/selenocysteine methylase
MAERTGLEPATPGVTGRYSNQLNYRSELENPSRLLGGCCRGRTCDLQLVRLPLYQLS